MKVYIAMRKSNRLLTSGHCYIEYVYLDENKAKLFVDKANKLDAMSKYYIDDREVEE